MKQIKNNLKLLQDELPEVKILHNSRSIPGKFTTPDFRILSRAGRKGGKVSHMRRKSKNRIAKLPIVRIQEKELDDEI